MPSANVLSEKQAAVAALAEKLQNATAGVLVDYKGITVEEDTRLRSQLRGEGIEYAVVKNTLLRFAVKNAGFDELDSVLEGATALAVTTGDPIAPARVLSKFSDELNNKFNVKAGIFEGRVITAEEVTAIGKLPPKEVLISQLLYVFNSPIASFARVIDAIAKKQEA